LEEAMSTTTTKPATVETKPEAKQPKEPSSFGIRFAARGDLGLWLRAVRTKSGWRTEVVYRQGKTNSRGMRTDHATADAARAALERHAEAAIKLGWARKESRGGGFSRRP
jgi:hypothetical protein